MAATVALKGEHRDGHQYPIYSRIHWEEQKQENRAGKPLETKYEYQQNAITLWFHKEDQLPPG